MGYGDYQIRNVTILRVYYMEGLGHNLFSVGENLGKLQLKADIDFDELTAMASEHSSLEPTLHEMTPVTMSSGLIANPPPSTPVDPPAPEIIASIADVVAPEPGASTGSPSSTTVDQDAPSPNKVMVITLKWIYKVKLDELGGILKNKARLVARGYIKERELILRNLLLHQPDGFVDKDNLNHVYKLKKALYGLKQAPRTCDPVDTPMVEKSKLDEDTQGKAVDPTHYHRMVDTLMYLTASRPHLTFNVCMYARYQAKPTKKHLHAVKIIFKYLRGTVNRGLWYQKDSSIALTSYADTDHVGCQDTRQSTSGSMQLLGDRLVSCIPTMALDSIKFQCTMITKALLPYAATMFNILNQNILTSQVENEVVELYFINAEYQLADIFTKALGRERIEFLINKLRMRSFTPETLKQLADEAKE
nr:hypothetical protein [Tanacetum cinerariifolium]